jgi:hypothetical protein
MRCQFLSLLLLSGASAFVAPVAPVQPRCVVRAEPPKAGEATAKKKGIPLALLIWPLLAVGDDVRIRVDTSTRVDAIDAPRENAPVDHRPQIYVSQVQPRLAEQGIETPALPYSNTNYLKK